MIDKKSTNETNRKDGLKLLELQLEQLATLVKDLMKDKSLNVVEYSTLRNIYDRIVESHSLSKDYEYYEKEIKKAMGAKADEKIDKTIN